MKHEQVIEFINAVKGTPFEWGAMDCTLFPAYCLDAMQDGQTAFAHVGAWSDQESALEHSKSTGITLEHWLEEHGCVEVEPNYMQVGDFILLHMDDIAWTTAAVYVGRDRAALCTEKGVHYCRVADIPVLRVVGLR